MNDTNYPSGPWTGFYIQKRAKYRQDLALEFSNGKITGGGQDNIGQFVIAGRYDATNGECYWSKAYVGAYDVFYRGFREGKGIWGTWEVDCGWTGGFHIWPLHSGTGDAEQVGEPHEQLAEIEEKAAHFLDMGRLMEQVHDFEAAIKHYVTALALEPINNTTWYFINNNLGYSLNQLKRHAVAESYCRSAIQTEPRRHNAYKNLGISLEGQGNYPAAALCFIKAVQTNAADPRALKHLEQLAENHPTVIADVVDFEAKLRACRIAVKTAAIQRN